MKNLENLERELRHTGRADELKKLAESESGKKLGEMVDPEKLKKAAEQGDTEAMRNIVQDVLKSEEGRKIAESLMKLMGG